MGVGCGGKSSVMVMGKYGERAKCVCVVEQIRSIIKYIHAAVLPCVAPEKALFEISQRNLLWFIDTSFHQPENAHIFSHNTL